MDYLDYYPTLDTETKEKIYTSLINDPVGVVIENDETWCSVKIADMFCFKRCYELRVKDCYSANPVVVKATSSIIQALEWLGI